MAIRWRRLLARITPPYGRRREMLVAEEVKGVLAPHLVVHTTLFEFEFKLIPVSPEVDAAVGFLSSAADVVSQSRGGSPGGFGSINGTLRLYQIFFLENETESLMERTFELHGNPTPTFLIGEALGQRYGNAVIANDVAAATQIAQEYFPKIYRTYCNNPSAKHSRFQGNTDAYPFHRADPQQQAALRWLFIFRSARPAATVRSCQTLDFKHTVTHTYYSQRKGINPNMSGLPLLDVVELFVRVFQQLCGDGYFHEAFGFDCVDAGHIDGKVRDIELEMLLTVRKKGLWPIHEKGPHYAEDDFFDIIEFLHQHVSKPIDGTLHNWNDCGMHWETFNKLQGQAEYRERVNSVLTHYAKPFEISASGEVLQKPEAGFEKVFDADIPSKDANVTTRINAAVLRYRRHGSTIDDRRQAVRDLSDVLEYLRPKVKSLLTSCPSGKRA